MKEEALSEVRLGHIYRLFKKRACKSMQSEIKIAQCLEREEAWPYMAAMAMRLYFKL